MFEFKMVLAARATSVYVTTTFKISPNNDLRIKTRVWAQAESVLPCQWGGLGHIDRLRQCLTPLTGGHEGKIVFERIGGTRLPQHTGDLNRGTDVGRPPSRPT